MIQNYQKNLMILAVILFLGSAFLFSPFLSDVLWSIIAAIIFQPLFEWLSIRLAGRNSLAAAMTVLVAAGTVLIPMILVGGLAAVQLAEIYDAVASGRLDLAPYFRGLLGTLPDPLRTLAAKQGYGSLDDAVTHFLAMFGRQAEMLIGQAFGVLTISMDFIISLTVTLYVTFFFVRDGTRISRRLALVVPLTKEDQKLLATTFVLVVRASVKGGVLVALAQGAIGGAILWMLGIQHALLLAMMMAVAALLPAVGTGLVWGPVAVYLLATGSIVQGGILVVCGIFVIGLVDNILRPILIGAETRLPDFVILVSTLGGVEMLGFDGLIVGPLSAALCIATWQLLAVRRRERRVATATLMVSETAISTQDTSPFNEI